MEHFDFHKIQHSHVIMGYVKEKQKKERKQKALDALKRKLDAVHEAMKREKAEKKQQDNICLITMVKYYDVHSLSRQAVAIVLLAARA